MRKDLTANFLAKMQSDTRVPIQYMIVRFPLPVKNQYLSDRKITVSGLNFQPLVEDWGTLSTVGAENAISSTLEAKVTIWNGGRKPFTRYFFDADPMDVSVELYQGFEGLGFADCALIGKFVIQDPLEYSEANTLVTLSLVSANMRYFGQVGEMLTRDKYPNALERDLNKPINLIVGDAGEVECLCSYKPPFCTMSGSILEKRWVKIYVHENPIELGFPSSGYLKIDDEVLHYSSRTSTYFQIDKRGQYSTRVSDHSDGVEIILRAPTKFIVGQGRVGTIKNVLVKGQKPTVNFSSHMGNADTPAIITFDEQPTYVEYSRGARTTTEDFDATSPDGPGNYFYNNAEQPKWAWSDAYPDQGAIISRPNHTQLAVVQTGQPKFDGQMVRLFLTVEHWATKVYYSDQVQVFVEGILDPVGRLVRPNERAEFTLEGNVNIRHGHQHNEGGQHIHGLQNPSLSTKDPEHEHSGELEGLTVEDGGNFGFPYDIYAFEGVSWIRVAYGSQSNLAGQRVRIRFTQTGTGKVYLMTGRYTGTLITWEAGSRSVNQLVNVPRGSYTSVLYLQVEGGGVVGGKVKVYEMTCIFQKSASIAPNYTGVEGILGTEQNEGTPGSAKLQYFDTGSQRIKSQNDVIELAGESGLTAAEREAERVRQLAITLQENASLAYTQRFDLTPHLESADWGWLHNRKVMLRYKTPASEDPEIIVTSLRFELEYRQKEVKTTDEVTCTVTGSISNRPDKVIDYLLINRAGVPSSVLGSVERVSDVWDDSTVWVDSNVWLDEGQSTTPPSDAYFEEAAAWYAYHNYYLNGVIDGSLTVKDAIAKICWQTRSKLLWQNGQAKLVVSRDISDWYYTNTLQLHDIQAASITARRSKVEDIVNSIHLYHTIDRLSAATGPEQYTASLTKTDAKSIARHGERVDDSLWMFDLLREPFTPVNGVTMPASIAAYYLWILGETTTLYELDTYLHKFDIEKDDYIQINAHKFDYLKNTGVVVRDIVRKFGSGKLGKINTLQMLTESVRRQLHIIETNNYYNRVFVTDGLQIDADANVENTDVVYVGDHLLVVEIVLADDSVTLSDSFAPLSNFRPEPQDTATILDDLTADMAAELTGETVTVTDNLVISQELCFGACGFGTLPFGAKTLHRPTPQSSVFISDEYKINEAGAMTEDQPVVDNLVISDGFGCRIGDGFGVTPFGC